MNKISVISVVIMVSLLIGVARAQDEQQTYDEEIYILEPVQNRYDISLEKGGTVIITGETQPSNTLIIAGKEVPINDDGTYHFSFIMPEGAHQIPIKIIDKDGNVKDFQQSVRIAKDYFFLIGFGEAEIGRLFHEGKIESLSPEDRDRLEKSFYFDGRLAYYLKAKIKGKYLITSSFDSDRERRELYKNLEPEDYYPIYGDASIIDYDATDTQDEFYLLIEADKSYAKWGSFGTGFTGTELSQFDRTLHGAKLHYESLSASRDGQPDLLATVFRAQVEQLASHNEFRGTGGSLYYLKHKDITMGSEKVYLEARDKINNMVVERIEQKEGIDYNIDYDQGRIIFYRPVHSVSDSSQTIISSEILNGNPLYVVADYEYEPEDTMKDYSAGARVSMFTLPFLRIGGTYVEEKRVNQDYKLAGVDTKIDLPFHTKLNMEYAVTRAEEVRNYISSDGGLSFTQVALPEASTRGYAYKAEFVSNPFLPTTVSGYFKKFDSGFAATESASQAATEKFGGSITQMLWPNAKISIYHDTVKLIQGGNESSVSAGSSRTSTTTIQAQQKIGENIDFTGEYQNLYKENPLDKRESTNTDTVAGKLTFTPDKLTQLFVAAQATLKGDENHQYRGGIKKNIGEDTDVTLTQIVGSEGDSTLLRVTKKVAEDSSVYTEYGLTKDDEGNKYITATFGGKTQLDDDTSIFAEDQHRSFQGQRQFAQRVGIGKKLNDKLSTDVSFERSRTKSKTQDLAHTAGKIGLDYLDVGRIRASADAELRFDDSAENKRQIVLSDFLKWNINDDLSFLTRHEYGLSENTTTNTDISRFSEFQAGFAYRPVKYDWLNLLAKYNRTADLSPANQEDINDRPQQIKEEFAIEGAFDISPRWTLVEKLARRNQKNRFTSGSLSSNQTYLWANRLNYHLTNKWDVAGEYRMLRQRQADDKKQGFLLEIDRALTDFIKVGMGYVSSDYDSDTASEINFETEGFYLRLIGGLTDMTPEELQIRTQQILEEKKRKNIGKLVRIEIKKENEKIVRQLNENILLAKKLYSEGEFDRSIEVWDETFKICQNLKNEAKYKAERHIQQEQNIKELSGRAKIALKEGDYQKAILFWEMVIEEAHMIMRGE